MWGRKNKKKQAQAQANQPAVLTDKELKAKIEEYNNSIALGEESIKTELEAFKLAAENLKVSSKKVSKVKGVYTNTPSRRTVKKHGDKIDAYNESLDEYVRIASHINWLLNTVSSCYEATARLNEDMKKYDAARKIRVKAEKYLADVNYKKAKLEKLTDGIVMPVATYVR